MTTPIPIIAPKKDYHINANVRTVGATQTTQTNLLVDESGNYLVDESGNFLAAIEIVSVNAYQIIAPKHNYHINAPARNNG